MPPPPNPHHNSPMQLRAALLLALTLALATACTAEDAPVPPTEPAPAASPLATPIPGEPTSVPTLATPTPQPLPADGPYGGVLVLANRGDPPSGFDTMRTSSIALHHVGGALFGPGNLVMRCRGNLYIACPYLAATWTVNPAFTEWTFTLRNDVFWHDGTPFTAEDVEFWFDLALNGYEVDGKVRAPAYFKGDLGEIASVDALPDNRVRIVLGERNRFFLDVLANPRLKFAHPRHLMEPRLQAGDVSVSPLDVGLVGLGPFAFEDYDRGTRVRVRRFDAYFETDNAGRPCPSSTASTTSSSASPPPWTPPSAPAASTVAPAASATTSPSSASAATTRTSAIPSSTPRWRAACSASPSTSSSPAPGRTPACAAPSPSGSTATPPSPSPSAASAGRRRASARPIASRTRPTSSGPPSTASPSPSAAPRRSRLMAEAGYSLGFSMGHLCRARQSTGCQLLQAQLRDLGVDLRIQLIDEGEWNRARTSLDFDSQQGRLSVLPIPEGTEGVYGTYSVSPDSYAKHEDPKVSELYRLLREATLPERRLEVWRQLQRYIFVDQTYVVPIAEAIYVAPYRTHVKGLTIPPEDGHTHTDFATVWLSPRP